MELPMHTHISSPADNPWNFSCRGHPDITRSLPQERMEKRSGFQWQPGSVTDQNHGFAASTKNELIGIRDHTTSAEWDKGIKYGFCTKTQDPSGNYFSQDWPKGKYCILRKSIDPKNPKCPKSKLNYLRLF